MKQIIHCILALCLFFPFTLSDVNAQKEEVRHPKYILSTKPLLLFDGEYKLSLETHLDNPNQWVGVGLSGFFLPDREGKTWSTRTAIDYDDYLKSLKGGGIDISFKQYFVTSILYAGGDLFYGHYQIKYDDFIFKKLEEDGLVFYERDFGIVKKHFNKVAANVYIGVGTPLKNRFFIDTYLGVGYSYSFHNENSPMFDSIFGFGYRGVYPVMGCRVGFTFGK